MLVVRTRRGSLDLEKPCHIVGDFRSGVAFRVVKRSLLFSLAVRTILKRSNRRKRADLLNRGQQVRRGPSRRVLCSADRGARHIPVAIIRIGTQQGPSADRTHTVLM